METIAYARVGDAAGACQLPSVWAWRILHIRTTMGIKNGFNVATGKSRVQKEFPESMVFCGIYQIYFEAAKSLNAQLDTLSGGECCQLIELTAFSSVANITPQKMPQMPRLKQ